jgi:transposase-like protein
MSNRIFTKEETDQLSGNENISGCNERSITYNKDFKVRAVKLYEQGLTPIDIFKLAGLDINLIGRKIPKDRLYDWNRIYRHKGEIGLLTEARGKKGGRPKKPKDLSESDKIKRLEAEVAYLKAENDFLAKLRAKRKAE